MESRAAVAYEAGKPLRIEAVQVQGVKATGVCHTDASTSVHSVVVR